MKLTNAELLARAVDGVITINDALTVDGDIIVSEKTLVVAGDIHAGDIDAGDIDAWDIHARDIHAWDIDAGNIHALNIVARNIVAGDIVARDINAGSIVAGSIVAGDINYYGFCVAYHSISASSIRGRRENSFHKTLDGEITIKKQGEGK